MGETKANRGALRLLNPDLCPDAAVYATFRALAAGLTR